VVGDELRTLLALDTRPPTSVSDWPLHDHRPIRSEKILHEIRQVVDRLRNGSGRSRSEEWIKLYALYSEEEWAPLEQAARASLNLQWEDQVSLLLAVALANQGKCAEAAEVYEGITRKHPGVWRFWLQTVFMQIHSGKGEVALKTIRMAREIFTEVVEVRSAYAWIAAENGSFEEADVLWILEREPNHVHAKVLLARIRLRQGRFDEAKIFMDEVRLKNPSDSMSHMAYIRDLVDLKEFLRATEQLEAVLEKKPRDEPFLRVEEYLMKKWWEEVKRLTNEEKAHEEALQLLKPLRERMHRRFPEQRDNVAMIDGAWETLTKILGRTEPEPDF
jgi:tetratricopeptide (TPR) repeat protein